MDIAKLKADCDNCFGLCCVVTAFGESEDFAFNRGPGTACPNLQGDDRCGIHNKLRDSGMTGCTKFDCSGAGQQISQVTFGGRSWRNSATTKTQMILAFSVMRPLHEMLWHLSDAESFATGEIGDRVATAFAYIESLTQGKANTLFKFGATKERAEIDVLLREASAQVRKPFENRQDFAGADLSNRKFIEADLAGVDFSGTSLERASFIGADLSRCDFLHAKFFKTDIRSADLRSAVYLTQMQVNGADGDQNTLLPERIDRPSHWAGSRQMIELTASHDLRDPSTIT